jgi:hypothetical protein
MIRCLVQNDIVAKNDLNQRILDIVAATEAEAQEAADRGDLAEAKRVLSAGIRDLRDYKRELTETERAIRDQYQQAKLQNRQAGQTVGMFVGSKTRAAMARGRAAQGRNLAANQAAALQPYAQAKMVVDRSIAAIDRAKADIAGEAARLRESGGAKASGVQSKRDPQVSETLSRGRDAEPAPLVVLPPPPPPVPAQWAPDPHGRHQHRYWDGLRWTEHVANDGIASVDPI